jgi:hypothetical protein
LTADVLPIRRARDRAVDVIFFIFVVAVFYDIISGCKRGIKHQDTSRVLINTS